MTQERNRVFAGELVSRASVDAAAGASLDEALTACDFDRAASIAIARAKAGEPVDAHAVGRILAGIEFPPLACSLVAIVRDKKALLDAVEKRWFPTTKDAAEIEAIALYAAWKAGAETARIIPQLRRLAARQLTAEAYALLSTIGASIEDANVTAALKPIATFAKEYAKSVASDDKAMHATIDGVLASLPANVEASRGGFTVRGPDKQVGRNDPCPCGSGLKYKKCCADKPQATSAPSPIPGVSWDEFLGAQASKMTPAHIEELALKDLVRVDLTKLGATSLTAVFRRFTRAHQWGHALRAIDAGAHIPPLTAEQRAAGMEKTAAGLRSLFKDDPERAEASIARLRDAEPADFQAELRDELIYDLVDVGELELAEAQRKLLPASYLEDDAFEQEIRAGGERAWKALIEKARDVATTRETAPGTELAFVLLRAEPVLGILAARACIGTWLADDAEMLLEEVEQVRDRLNLPPTDPAWDVFDTIMAAEGKPTKSDDEAKLQKAMLESNARIAELERTLASVKSELADAKTRPAAELMRQTGSQDKLGEKVRELEALIREGNEERRELRKQLETAAEKHASEDDRPRRGRAHAEEAAPDDDDGDALEIGSRNVAIPRFERRALDALADVPAAVAAETMRTIGNLAAGDAYAWRNVKAAKDMPRQVLMGRVGIHHRLIFRSEGGNLDVLDLITRETLQTTLKRLRQGR